MIKEIERVYYTITANECRDMELYRFKQAINELGISDFLKIKECTKRMAELQELMIKDKNFRLLYERSFDRYFKIRKNLIKKLIEI